MFGGLKAAPQLGPPFLLLLVFEGGKAKFRRFHRSHTLPAHGAARVVAAAVFPPVWLWDNALRHQPKLVNQNTAKVPAVQRGLDDGQRVNRRHSNRICL